MPTTLTFKYFASDGAGFLPIFWELSMSACFAGFINVVNLLLYSVEFLKCYARARQVDEEVIFKRFL